MLVNDKQKEFFKKRIDEGKSFTTIAKEMDISEEILEDWAEQFLEIMYDIENRKIDQIKEEFKLFRLPRIKYMASLYARLQKELDKRDFSGLPTDKLYNILMDVKDRINRESNDNFDDYPNDDYDDFYDDLDWEDE